MIKKLCLRFAKFLKIFLYHNIFHIQVENIREKNSNFVKCLDAKHFTQTSFFYNTPE